MPRDETAPTPDDRIDDLWDEVQALRLAVMALMRALTKTNPAAAELVPQLMADLAGQVLRDLPGLDATAEGADQFARVLGNLVATGQRP